MKFAEVTMTESDVMQIRYTGAQCNMEGFEEYLHEVLTLAKQHPGCVQVYDGTRMPLIPSAQRIRHGKWIKENEALLASHVRLSLLVVPNILVRMVMRGIFLIQKPVSPYKILQSLEEVPTHVSTFRLSA